MFTCESPIVIARYLLCVLALLALPHLSPLAAQDRPNIVLINVDDLDTELFETGRVNQTFPNLQKLASEGVRFTNCHATSPLCGPSRASLLTGLYVHHHQVRVQDPQSKVSNGFAGGYEQFHQSLPSADNPKPDWTQHDLGIAMQQSGYRTMLVGKYLHSGFTPQPGQNWRDLHPSGWDDFYCTLGGLYFQFNQYLGSRGERQRDELRHVQDLRLADYPTEDRPYLYSRYRTNVEWVDAWNLVRQHVDLDSTQPFFLYLAPFAPHRPSDGSMIDVRYQNWWPNLRQPHAPDFNHAADGAKPEWLRLQAPMDVQQIEETDRQYRERTLAMKSVDDMLGVFLQRLESIGVLDNTVVLFTSDNGYMLGHQRHLGKQLPYDRCTRVPLVVWGPASLVRFNQSRDHLISQVDLFPTILELAGSQSLQPTDGQSINELLRPGAVVPNAESWRPEGVLSEHYQRLGHAWKDIQGVYLSLRLYDQRYTEWADGVREWYPIHSDPWERDNQFSDLDSGDQHLFHSLLFSAFSNQSYHVSIASPHVPQPLVFRGTSLSGYASTAVGVRQVRLVFSRQNAQGDREYWNGRQWSPQYSQNLAQLQNPGGMVCRWDWRFQPDGTGSYPVTMTVRTYGMDGSFQPTVLQKVLLVEHDAPATSILSHASPLDTIPAGQPLTISGAAKGEKAITQVRVVVRDTMTGQYHNGTKWQTGYCHVAGQLSTDFSDETYREWSLTLPASAAVDRLYVSARAYQAGGDFDLTVPWTVLKRIQSNEE